MHIGDTECKFQFRLAPAPAHQISKSCGNVTKRQTNVFKHKVKKAEGTSTACQDLVLIDEAAGAAGKGEDKAGVDMADRVALGD
jgi:hypothetical protein